MSKLTGLKEETPNRLFMGADHPVAKAMELYFVQWMAGFITQPRFPYSWEIEDQL